MQNPVQSDKWRRQIFFVVITLLIFYIVCSRILNVVLSHSTRLVMPTFHFSNVGPCLGEGEILLTAFKAGDPQYICGDFETDEPNVVLYLNIYTREEKDKVYDTAGLFTSGSIAFQIDPPLPPGEYWGYIYWSRSALVDFDFDVLKSEMSWEVNFQTGFRGGKIPR